VRHPWVDSIGRLSCPLLDRWGSSGMRLAAVVAEAYKGLGGSPAPAPTKAGAAQQGQPAAQQGAAQQQQQHPPPAQHASSGQLGGAGSGLGSGPASLAPAASGASVASSSGGPPRPPPIPTSREEAEGLTDEELSAALADREAYQALVAAAAARLNLWQARAEGPGGEAGAHWLPRLQLHSCCRCMQPLTC
jgi:ESCRT-I complex subunit VPS37